MYMPIFSNFLHLTPFLMSMFKTYIFIDGLLTAIWTLLDIQSRFLTINLLTLPSRDNCQ